MLEQTTTTPHPVVPSAILDRMADIVLLLDGDGVIRYANAAARGWSIQPGERLLESPILDAEDLATIHDAWNRLIGAPGQSVTAALRLHRGSATARVIVTAENLIADPTFGAVLVTATEARRGRDSDERLRQGQRLESIGRLAGGIAHDFNNLLTTIGGLTRLTLSDESLSDAARADLDEVVRAADSATAVTRRLLAFSRRQMLRPRRIALDEQLPRIEEAIVRLIGEAIVVRVIGGARDPHVLFDPTQLEQILLNLAMNAREAMPYGGMLTLRTEDRPVRSEETHRFPHVVRPGDYLLLEVSDTGPGIPPRLRERVFEPFFTTKSSQHAAGLGLSTVYGIVKQSGGYVWIDEAEGGGARISILLPRPAVDDIAADSPAVQTATGGHGGTVLIAEDDPAVRAVARRTLEASGYTVLEARDGAQALEICSTHGGGIDLLLSDVVMPGISGRELVERCRRARPETAVLFMSGFQDDGLLRREVGTGAESLIEKPFSPEELTRRVRERIAARRVVA